MLVRMTMPAALRRPVPRRSRWYWTIAIAVIATISLAWGNIAALTQRNVKRLLAYSSVSHAGFLLMPIAAGNALGGRALLFYLVPYAALSIGSFAVVAALVFLEPAPRSRPRVWHGARSRDGSARP